MKNPKFWATMIVLSLVLSITSSVVSLLTLRRAILNREVVQALDVMVWDTQIAEEDLDQAADPELLAEAAELASAMEDSVQPAAAEQPQKTVKKAQPKQEEQVEEPKVIIGETYVDLGLPSGTLWKAQNEDGLMGYDVAKKKFGRSLPSLKQWEELNKNCVWEWTGDGYNVTGPNGKCIFIPAAGYRNVSGQVGKVGVYGNYWSSTSKNKDEAWRFGFEQGKFSIAAHSRQYGRSIRLVEKRQFTLEDIGK